MGKVVHLTELRQRRLDAKQKQQVVVFTNGIFDILHRGHIEYLNASKALGDILMVGLNTDKSVRILKGEKKPIVPQDDRAFILSQLHAVDYVCMFEEETPQQIISQLLPDILVKGADYGLDEIVGRKEVEENGGKVIRVTLTPNQSTTNIIETIVDRFCGK